MPRFWKLLVGVAIALPMAAYVAGSFSATSTDDPVRRDPIQISDVRETPEAEKPARGTDPSAPPSRRTPVNGDDDDDEDDNDDVRVVTPKPTRVDGGDDVPERDDDDTRDGGDDSDDGEGD